MNWINLKYFKMHPLLKRHILSYSNGPYNYLEHGLPDIRPIKVNNADRQPF